MPSRNTLKTYAPQSYYHVYARGINKQDIFLDKNDYGYFIKLFNRYLTKNKLTNTNGLPYPYYGDVLELTVFCLMPNHFHLLIYQHESESMSKFMRSLMTSYSRYFNKKYKRTGALFESRYKAARISNESYLQHISRYIHLNPRYWRRYQYSSLPYFLGEQSEQQWLRPGKIMHMFSSTSNYLEFLNDYEDRKKVLSEIKNELADR